MLLENKAHNADTEGVGVPVTNETGAPVSVFAIVPTDFVAIDTKSDLKKAHERLIQALTDDIRNKVPINAEQFLTYNPIGGVYMPITDEEKQTAVQTIAQSAPSIIEAIFKQSWVTTVLGIVTLIPAVLTVSGIETGWWGGIVSAISAGAGLIFSKSVTQKQ